VLAWLALALSLLDAAVPPREPSPWLEKPVRLGGISDKDWIAREHLLNSLNEKQTDEFRRDWEVVIPELPTGLPDDYDILVYGQHVGMALLRLEVQVRGRHANAELVTVAGIRRGELPADECDDLARQIAYAFGAEQSQRRTEMREWPPSLRYGLFATHARRQRLELVSRDRLMRLHLRTEAWQTLTDTVSANTAGVPGFAHAQVSQTLERMAREQLPLIEPGDELRRELVSRLQRIPEPTVASKPNAYDKPRPALRYGEAGVVDTPRLLACLRAADLETRTRAALDFAKFRRIDAAWLRDVGRRLVADGAAPETCDPFLHPEAHRPPEPQGRSIEGTHW
jgi:hypothetical protein